jgi:hypothetical protein
VRAAGCPEGGVWVKNGLFLLEREALPKMSRGFAPWSLATAVTAAGHLFCPDLTYSLAPWIYCPAMPRSRTPCFHLRLGRHQLPQLKLALVRLRRPGPKPHFPDHVTKLPTVLYSVAVQPKIRSVDETRAWVIALARLLGRTRKAPNRFPAYAKGQLSAAKSVNGFQHRGTFSDHVSPCHSGH